MTHRNIVTHQNVLLLSAGRRVELLQSFQTSLHRHCPDAEVLTADVDPEHSAACRLAERRFKVPPGIREDYIDVLLSLCRQERIGLVIPTIDTDLLVLARHRRRFLHQGTQLVISDPSLIAACRDKRRTAALFKRLGIDTPEIYSRRSLTFPCFCKPFDGSSGVGACVIDGPHMLTDMVLHDRKNMFMELVGQEYQEYTVDAYFNGQGRLRCLVPRKRLEVRSGEVSKAITQRGHLYDYLLARLARLPGARGCLTVQLFQHPMTGAIKALEINPRFGGGFPLADAAGAHYPDWLIQEYLLGRPIDFYDRWEANLMMLRYDAKILVSQGAGVEEGR